MKHIQHLTFQPIKWYSPFYLIKWKQQENETNQTIPETLCVMYMREWLCVKHEDFKSAHYRTMFTVTNISLHSSDQINYVICIGCYFFSFRLLLSFGFYSIVLCIFIGEDCSPCCVIVSTVLMQCFDIICRVSRSRYNVISSQLRLLSSCIQTSCLSN